MRDYSRIAARVFNTPLLLTPEAAASVGDFLFARLTTSEAAETSVRVSSSSPAADDDRPYLVDDGVATIPIRGELVNRGSWMSAFSGLTSYETLAAALAQANDDYRVKSILLDIDSPGGEAAGAMEAAAKVRASGKPVVAFVNSLAASAAYAIAAGAREIVTLPSATLGSIGVVWVHMDRSQAMKDRGVKPTLLHAGAYKVDGHSMGPLPDDARERIQGQIDQVYGLFVASVGKHRSKLGEEGARKSEAGLFMGDRAVEAGLADRVGDMETARSRARARGGPEARFSAGNIDMAVKLHSAGESHAEGLIKSGKVDKSSSWSFSGEDGDKLLGASGDDWTNYAAFHLGEDDAEKENTKARFKYPYGKDGKVYRSGVIAAKSRAASEGAKDIESAASRLLEKIDGDEKQKKEAALADEQALAAATKKGATDERARILAILDNPAAKGKTALARHFALSTDMSVEVAVAALAAAAPETPSDGKRMDRAPAVDVRPSPSQREENPQAEIDETYKSIAAKLNKQLPERFRPH